MICNYSDRCFGQIPASEMREFAVFLEELLDGRLEDAKKEVRILELIL